MKKIFKKYFKLVSTTISSHYFFYIFLSRAIQINFGYDSQNNQRYHIKKQY